MGNDKNENKWKSIEIKYDERYWVQQNFSIHIKNDFFPGLYGQNMRDRLGSRIIYFLFFVVFHARHLNSSPKLINCINITFVILT